RGLISGVALVAKPGGPEGPTSHDVVDAVRRAVGTDRVGHLGTLDPFASGLLVLVLGRATRLAPFAVGWAKAYDGMIRLGTTTAPPDVGFRATVSGGTYLRSLARDVGEALGCGAHLASLRRTRVGPFRLADAVAPDAVTAHALRDPAELVRELPARELDDAGRAAVVHGRPVPAGSEMREAGWVALFANGALVAVAERVDDVLKPRVVVVEQ